MRSHLTICIKSILLCLILCSCDTEPKTKRVELSYLVKEKRMRYKRTSGALLFNVNPKMKAWVTVTNTSDYGGIFKFNAKMSCQGNAIELEAEEFIPAGGTIDLVDEIAINSYSFESDITADWKIIAPIKTITSK